MENILTSEKVTETEQNMFFRELTAAQNKTINHLYNRHKENTKYTFLAIYKHNNNAILKVKGNTHKQTMYFMIFEEGSTMANSTLKEVTIKLNPIYLF